MIDRDKYAFIPMEEYNELKELKANFDLKKKELEEKSEKELEAHKKDIVLAHREVFLQEVDFESEQKMYKWKRTCEDYVKEIMKILDEKDDLQIELDRIKKSFWHRLWNRLFEK